MQIVLISTYELGRQPFGLASPAAWLRREGHAVTCTDISREPLPEAAVRAAGLVAFYVPMHTATRLAAELLEPVRRLNPNAHLCFYGLYAPVNEAWLRGLGAGTILGGEFEPGLVSLAERLAAGEPRQTEPLVSFARLKFITPDRSGLSPLASYARLVEPDGRRRTVGYTEASRGCKHLCRHCPIVPVYHGAFRVVARDVVLEDIRRQVRAGAEHITFGDPDFFNGPAHAVAIVEALHREFPRLGYDATIKVEHLLKHAELLPRLVATGCRFVTSAAESVDDAVLSKLAKGHTRADLLAAAELCRAVNLPLVPTFIPFTPWTTLEGYAELLEVLASSGLVSHVAPVQLSIRLLIPAGSHLFELEEIRRAVGPFDAAALVYPWRNPDERVERLGAEVARIVEAGSQKKLPREEIFSRIWAAAAAAHGDPGRRLPPTPPEAVRVARAAIPYLDEPWYC
jgi:radical SAM superfamily enzyme YgiQ (UPF0313 family)